MSGHPHFINRVQLLGYVGKLPLLRQRKDGKGLSCHFRMATHEYSIFEEATRKFREIVQWHYVSVWPQALVERAKVIKPGDRVFVEGSLHAVSWMYEGRRMNRTEVHITLGGMVAILRKSTMLEIEEEAAQMRAEEEPAGEFPPAWVGPAV